MHRKTFSIEGRIGRRLLRLGRCAVLVAPLLAGLSSEAMAGFTIFGEPGGTLAAVTAERDAFRLAIGGGTVAGANGNFGGLRREINWDAVPDARSDPNLMPANFFNVNSPRGAVFSTPGTGFLLSSTVASGQPILFGFPGDLQTFSAERLFAPVGSSSMDINFFVPGTTTAATTSAFGAIFVDVEDKTATNFTSMEFFDLSGSVIFTRTVTPATTGIPQGNQGLSFLGGVADAGERIAKVRITTTPGNALLGNNSRANEVSDFVVMDDFIYATPLAVPEPSMWALSLLGLAVVGWRSRKRA